MTLPEAQFRDIMRRTKRNLEIIEQRVAEERLEGVAIDKFGPYEVTQLVNSLLGAVALPRERELRKALSEISMIDAINRYKFPSLVDEYPDHPPRVPVRRDEEVNVKPENLDDFVRLLRNAFLHGNIELLGDVGEEIRSIRFENRYRGKPTWGSTIAVAELRNLVTSFCTLAESLYEERENKLQGRVA
jgi:hypothetical protein